MAGVLKSDAGPEVPMNTGGSGYNHDWDRAFNEPAVQDNYVMADSGDKANASYLNDGWTFEDTSSTEESGINWAGAWDTVKGWGTALWDSDLLWAGISGLSGIFGGDGGDAAGGGGPRMAGGGSGGGRPAGDYTATSSSVSALGIQDTKGRTVGTPEASKKTV